ncbi:hypothetical protein ABEB36_005470 [Hypothenemus hampei]|uniref:Uncharacterized protein n=1 Tax=Hypothenemus hampei TaxID=57062 RepID=A0ABD1EYB3_HYPHA
MFLKALFLVFLFCGFCYAISVDNSYESNHLSRGLDAKSVLTTLASSLMSRGYGTTGMGSQVISLNLTNLLILVLLKALIFAAASLGHKGGDNYFRSADSPEQEEQKFLTDEEILMFLSYLTGTPGNNGCLQNISCHQPEQAKKYVNAGDVLLKAAKMLSYQTDDVYEYIIKEMDHAANVGIAGGNCGIFRCDNDANNNNIIKN